MLSGGGSALDALSALVTAAAEAAGKAKHVYVLKFFGDVTASQVAQLRQEVTAVLQTADVEGRGDDVGRERRGLSDTVLFPRRASRRRRRDV